MSTDFPYVQYESFFAYRPIAPNTWCFNTCFQTTPVSSDAFLLWGNSKAVMIDCGMSKLNLKTYIDQLSLTDKPIIGVIDTHSHFDHTACNGLFGRAFMHPKAEAGATSGTGSEFYPAGYPITYLHEGDVIDLGNRVLEIFEIPAHDPGSIAILDRTNRILFTGDELESGWVKLNLNCSDTKPGQTIRKHIENMKRLKAMSDRFDMICPSHHGNPISKEIIDHFIVCGAMLLADVETNHAQIDPASYDLSAIPIRERPQVYARYKSAHLGYFLGYAKEQSESVSVPE